MTTLVVFLVCGMVVGFVLGVQTQADSYEDGELLDIVEQYHLDIDSFVVDKKPVWTWYQDGYRHLTDYDHTFPTARDAIRDFRKSLDKENKSTAAG